PARPLGAVCPEKIPQRPPTGSKLHNVHLETDGIRTSDEPMPDEHTRTSDEPMPDEHAPPGARLELFARITTPPPGRWAAQIHTGPRYHHTPGSPPGIGAYSALACHPGTTSHTPGSGLPGSGSAISVPSSGPPTSRTSFMRQLSQTPLPVSAGWADSAGPRSAGFP